MLTLLTTAARRWMEERRHRSQLRALLQKDDRLIEDAGLRRADVEEALNLPRWDRARDHAYSASARSLTLDGLR